MTYFEMTTTTLLCKNCGCVVDLKSDYLLPTLGKIMREQQLCYDCAREVVLE